MDDAELDKIIDDLERELPRQWGLWSAIIFTALFIPINWISVGNAPGSTASIGYFFIPIFAAILFFPVYGVGWCIGYFIMWRQSESNKLRTKAILFGMIPVAVFLWIGKEVGEGLSWAHQVRLVQNMDESELKAVLNEPRWARNKYVLGAIAENPNATAAELHRIAITDLPALHTRMGSAFDVLGKNKRGLSVMRLVAKNPNTAAADLEILAKSTDSMVLEDVANNPKLSEATLRRLEDQVPYAVEMGLARNTSTPPDTLSRISMSRSQYTRGYVAGNPNTPQDALEVLSKDPVWHVRERVARNTSTPRKTVERLAQDSDQRVRAAAQSSLRRN